MSRVRERVGRLERGAGRRANLPDVSRLLDAGDSMAGATWWAEAEAVAAPALGLRRGEPIVNRLNEWAHDAGVTPRDVMTALLRNLSRWPSMSAEARREAARDEHWAIWRVEAGEALRAAEELGTPGFTDPEVDSATGWRHHYCKLKDLAEVGLLRETGEMRLGWRVYRMLSTQERAAWEAAEGASSDAA